MAAPEHHGGQGVRRQLGRGNAPLARGARAPSQDAGRADTANGDRYGAPSLMRQRLGQGAFRPAVTDGYNRRCAVSGEKTLPVLDAAHIRGYADGGDHDVANGLLLRTDIHRLFDLGYVTVTDKRTFAVSPRLWADIDNGVDYPAMQGQELAEPKRGFAPASLDALQWHRENRYLG
jgi:putative restriction endonuclease